MNHGINLLPWREARRRRQRRQLWTAIVVICIVAASVFATAWWTQSEEISFQTSRNAYLLREIRKVQTQLEEIDQIKQRKKALVARMTIIRQLQQKKSASYVRWIILFARCPRVYFLYRHKEAKAASNLRELLNPMPGSLS